MASVSLKEIKADLYNFLENHSDRLNLLNYQFRRETGDDLNRALSWFGHDEKIEDARFHAEFGTYAEYFGFCIRENYFSLQIGDGSLVQMHLRPDQKGGLTGGSLAFIPRPGNGHEYFRFDCEPTQARHYRHNRYHIHFGFSAHNMRVSAYQFPWPSEFLAFLGHLMSDEKGRVLEEGEFQADVHITAFHHEHLLRNLEACGERFNHCFQFVCRDNGGTRSPDLRGLAWQEHIT